MPPVLAVMLEGPIAPRLLRLAWPVLIVLALQTFVGVAETYFVSFLGTDALAGVTLVFPLFMLMTMMSNGAIGGGVSSAIARALGAGRRHDADALVSHAVVLGVVFGALFSVGVWTGGPALFKAMGGADAALANAVLYANVVFLAAIPGWVANLLAASLRGAGNVRVPAIITAAGAFVTLALSPLFIFGWGWVPRMGVAGAGVALIVFNVGALLALVLYMRSPASPLRLGRARLEGRLFRDILRVGLLSAAGTVLANLTVVVTTGLVGAYGRDAIAGYGLASRLDYLLIPLLFALGTASVTMVGTNVGAGQHARARRIAWTGALVSGLATGAIGLAAALFPEAWIHLFSREPMVVETGSAYLVRVAPLYAVFGVGMSLYFASQGAGRMAWPFSAGVVRLFVVLLAGGYWMSALQGSLNGLYWIVAASYSLFGFIIAFGMASGLVWAAPSSEKDTYTARWSPEAAARTIEVRDGLALRYLKIGEGRPLVLLHTIRTQLDFFERLAPLLQDHYTVYAVDLPGHGQSTIARATYDEQFFRVAIVQLIERLELRDVVLAGESIGGVLALTVAAELPDRVSQVISINPYDYGERFGGGIRRSRSGWIVGLFSMFGEHTIEARFLLRRALDGAFRDESRLSDALADELHRAGRRRGFRWVEYSVFANWQSWIEARSRYRSVRVPITLVYSEFDWSSAEERRRNRTELAGARYVHVPGAGHFSSLERPEEIAAIIKDATERPPTDSAPRHHTPIPIPG